ncbi:MAG: hypothetical protein JW876_08110 [Candidatus Krumholzibacteriota bacterium]|nr:hypothetical protein [Candidatus Krumholzibacteriota bacterium]
MKTARTRGLAALILLPLAAVLLSTPACIFDPDKAEEPPVGPTVPWPDRTQKEDCIQTILLAYQYKDAGTYDDLLHPDFEWHLQYEDAQRYGIDYWAKSDDLELTRQLFSRALVLDLTIESAAWDTISAVGDVPCPDCWKTTRIYEIQAQLEANGNTLIGNDLIQVIVAPDTDEPGKWQIKYMYDLSKE